MKPRMEFRGIYLAIFAFVLLYMSLTNAKSNDIGPGEEEYAVAVEKPPAPVGGMESIARKIVYPEMAMRMRVEGKVYMLIYLSENGDVDDVKVVKGIGGGCDEEAAKAIKKTKFTPGMNKGAAVKTKLAIALTFKLAN